MAGWKGLLGLVMWVLMWLSGSWDIPLHGVGDGHLVGLSGIRACVLLRIMFSFFAHLYIVLVVQKVEA